MTTVAISQPMYFPWVGFLAQMRSADIFIWLNDAQFSRGSFTNRVQVKTATGRTWMSIPLAGKGAFQRIDQLQAADDECFPRHRALLQQSFLGRPHCRTALDLFDRALAGRTSLCEALIGSAEILAQSIGVLPERILRSSEMGVAGGSWRRVLDLVKAVGGTRYVTGHGALAYLDHAEFEVHGVEVRYMDYDPVPWPQPLGTFTPFVTGLDLVASVGANDAAQHLNPATIDWRAFATRKEQAP